MQYDIFLTYFLVLVLKLLIYALFMVFGFKREKNDYISFIYFFKMVLFFFSIIKIDIILGSIILFLAI